MSTYGTDYIALDQTTSWPKGPGNNKTEGHPGSDQHCCVCGRDVDLAACDHVLVVRDMGGDWYVIRPGAPAIPDEGQNSRTTEERIWLPIGPCCLRSHPQYRIGLKPKSATTVHHFLTPEQAELARQLGAIGGRMGIQPNLGKQP